MSAIQSCTIFESLPNEILMQCFRYLNAFDLFHALDRLNYRLSNLIHYIPLHINFENVSKSVFDEFCTKMMRNPRIKTQIQSLQISNEDEYLQSSTFLSYFSLNEFIHLQKFESILPLECSTRRRLWSKSYRYLKIKLVDLSLLKLRTLSMIDIDSSVAHIRQTFLLIHLTISQCYLSELHELLQHAPLLKYLRIKYAHSDAREMFYRDRCYRHLEELIIDEISMSMSHPEPFLKQTPNLKSLTITASGNNKMLDAYRWEKLIISSLPLLNVFNFSFSYLIVYERNIVFNKFKQFQTSFWRNQHDWYTEFGEISGFAFIYTIPSISNKYELDPHCPSHCNNLVSNIHTFMRVKDLVIHKDLPENCQCYFSNVTSLKLISLDTKDLNVSVNLYNLKHLHITDMNDPSASLIMLEILKQAPHVSSLTVDRESLRSFLNDHELCKYLHKMMKRLHVDGYWRFRNDNDGQAKQFCDLFSSIEHLQCTINADDDILFLLNHLSKLSTLKVTRIGDGDHEKWVSQFENDVRKRNLIYDIKVDDVEEEEYSDWGDSYHDTIILIWIGKALI